MERLSCHKERHRPALASAGYDVVVIGAGIGGLSAAIELAGSGASVLVLERHVVPGGCCSAFARKGFLFDVGVHNLAGGGRYASYGALLRRLGVDIELLEFPDNGTVLVADSSFCIPRLHRDFKALLCQQFPKEAQGLQGFFRAFVRLYREVWRSNHQPLDGPDTYGQWLRGFIADPRCRWLLGALWPYLDVPPERLALREGILTLGSYLLQGTYYPKGGTQALANAYVQRLEELGGTVALRMEVQEIVARQGELLGVRCGPDGLLLPCRAVLANTSPHTLDGLLQRDAPPPALEASPSAFVYYLGLSPKADLSGIPWGFYFDHLEAGSGEWLFLSKPHELDSSIAPEGHQVLLAMKSDTGPFLSRQGYKGQKQAGLERLLERLERRSPGLREQLLVQVVGSPHTIERYTGNPRGAVYGWAALPHQSGSLRPGHATALPWLFAAGHWTQPGSGVPAVTWSGIQSAQLALRYLDA